MNNSEIPVFDRRSVLPTPSSLFNTAEVCNKTQDICDNQPGPSDSTPLISSTSTLPDSFSNHSTKSSHTIATYHRAASRMLGSPTEFNPAKNNSQENIASTVNKSSSDGPATNRSPLATVAPPAMSTPLFTSPARQHLLHRRGLTCFALAQSVPPSNRLDTEQSAMLLALKKFNLPSLYSLMPHIKLKATQLMRHPRSESRLAIISLLNYPPMSSQTDSICFAVLKFLSPLVFSWGSKVILPKALLVQASPYFQTTIVVETLGQITRETLKIECSTLAFDFVVQYLYTGTFVRPDITGLTNLIEFYELVEKLSLDISDMILDNIKELLMISRLYLQAEHIRKVASFSNGQTLQMLFARSCIKAYLQSVNPTYVQAQEFRLQKELDVLDGFAADLMRVYREVADKRTPCIFAESCDLLDGNKFSY
ncbi:uncharacterized protein EAE97_007507 [Botrytis byssoidea]|uniref:BTB domain-containing protein n=1 Tax=Botrytis byssoidea TaxID=139641 RepID=A0A9P5M0H4_9HELO|nr:uncharacterized protein EAE97_007507 [Botrytis byssoidea]KAF7937711.1 hypothetical protein EAE97_007507 [Botrytis byssoidea]